MKKRSMFLLAILLAALLVIFQAMIYAFTYDVCITKVVAEFGYQVPKIQFEMFIMIEVFRQLIISGKPSKDSIKVEFGSDEFWKQMFTFFFTKITWLIVCFLISMYYEK